MTTKGLMLGAEPVLLAPFDGFRKEALQGHSIEVLQRLFKSLSGKWTSIGSNAQTDSSYKRAQRKLIQMLFEEACRQQDLREESLASGYHKTISEDIGRTAAATAPEGYMLKPRPCSSCGHTTFHACCCRCEAAAKGVDAIEKLFGFRKVSTPEGIKLQAQPACKRCRGNAAKSKSTKRKLEEVTEENKELKSQLLAMDPQCFTRDEADAGDEIQRAQDAATIRALQGGE